MFSQIKTATTIKKEMNFNKPLSHSVNTPIEVNEIIDSLSKDKIIVYTYGVWDLFPPVGIYDYCTELRC